MAPSNLDHFWVQGLSHRPDTINLPLRSKLSFATVRSSKIDKTKTDMNSGLCKTTPSEPLEHDEEFHANFAFFPASRIRRRGGLHFSRSSRWDSPKRRTV